MSPVRRLTALRGAPYAVLALALAGSLAVTWYVHHSLDMRDRARFQAEADGARHAIEQRINSHVTLVKATAGLFAATDSVSAADFFRFVDRLEIATHYLGLRSIGYSERVPPGGDSALVRRMRREGFPEFRLWPAEPDSERQAVLYLQPIDSTNRSVLGFDMLSRADRRAAMQAARDSAIPVTSARLQTLTRVAGERPTGFLIYLAVYRTGVPPASVAERRAQLQGYVYAGFRTADLFDALFSADSSRKVDLRIYDGSTPAPAALMYDSRATAGERGDAPRAAFVDTIEASVAGRPWAMIVRSRPDFRSASIFWTGVALVLGVLVSAALYGIARLQSGIGAELRESESRFRSVIDQSLFSTQVLRPDGTTALVNRAWEQLWGTTLAEMRDYNLLTDPQLESAGIVALLRRAFGGEPVELPPLAYRPGFGEFAGVDRWVRAFAYPVRAADGRVTEVVLVHEDISERRQADEQLRYQLDLLAAITTNAEDALFLMDADGRVTFLNPAAERMFGWSREELEGRVLHDVLHHRRPDGTPFPAEECGLGEVFRSGATVRNHQDVFIRRDGTPMAVVCSNGPIVRDGRVTSAVLVVVDDTARRQAEEARTRLAAIVESSEDAIVGKRLDGVIESWNHGAERIFGYPAAEMIGESMSRLIPPDRQDEEVEFLARVGRGEHVAHRDTVRLTRDGQRLDVAVSIFPVRAAGRIVGAATVMRDITEPKRREEALRHTQKLESIGVLAGGIAHDFNNLLTGIIGNASLAARSVRPDTEAAELLADVISAGERAADLTTQLLAYAGKGRLFVAPVNVSQLVQGITRLILASIPKKVTLRVDTVPGLPPVEADASQLQQLVMNLVINGAESVGDAAGQVLVRTRLRTLDLPRAAELYPEFDLAAGDYVEIEVRDSGSGMDPATMRRIFDPFFTTKFMGRGLGLAAAIGIVRSHHGAIGVVSTPGLGTTFTVVLPASDGTARRPTPAPAVNRPVLPAEGLVLVVDDEEIVRQAAGASLTAAGYDVEYAVNGAGAVEQVRRLGPALRLVLLDLTMPVMGGAEAYARIRELRADLPVIASSGYGEAETISQFRGSGVTGFLQKPYTADRLRQAVADALARRV